MPKSQPTAHASLFRRPVPQMPDGYYAGDQPNPHLRAFVEAHLRQRPYDPLTDTYAVPAFTTPIETTKATAIYNMHTYWSKKPHDAIRQYIQHYTQPGDLVLDPFCGSGGTALAALMEGRKAVAIDRSPAATFITKNYCTPVDVEALQAAFADLKAKVAPEMAWLYGTRCDRCGGPATTGYTVYSQVFECPRCLSRVPLFDCVEVEGQTAAGKPKTVMACPHCRARGIVEEISTRGTKFGAIPVLVSYLCEGGCKPARGERRHNDGDPKKREYFERYDLGKLKEIEARDIPYWYPTDRMMHAPEDQEEWGVKWRAGTSNFRTVDELFTKRNLWALAAIKDAAERLEDHIARDVVLFALTGVSLGMTRMNQYRPDVTYPTSIMKGTYYVPQIFQEEPPLKHVLNKLDRLGQGFDAIREHLSETRLLIDTRSATDMTPIPPNSVDYIFTDPPYADKVQYGELNFVWEAWLGFDTRWHADEIIVNPVRGKSEDDWAAMMRLALAECFRVLKPGRWLSLCYHDTSEGTWSLVQDLMAEVGFLVDHSDDALYIDTGQKSFNQLTADKVTKRDLVINFRKPRPGETAAVLLSGDEDEPAFLQGVRALVHDFLAAQPGATKDRVYDHVVSRLVRTGRMQAHDFDALLLQVADPVALDGAPARWYLKDAALVVEDKAETAREDAAAASLGRFMRGWLGRHAGEEGVHYSDLFEHYVYAVHDKPRRTLVEWLPDYFYQTEAGTYRLPGTEEEAEAKAQGRTAGTNRRIKRYLALLDSGQGVPERERVSDATLAEWIRHAKRAGLYAAGVALYERGGLNVAGLSEEGQVGVEEDYATCVRLLARGQADKPAGGKKRGRKSDQPELGL